MPRHRGREVSVAPAASESLAYRLIRQPHPLVPIAAHRTDADAACATYEAWRAPAVRPYESGDPSRTRLRGTSLAPGRPEERWPPSA
jgi:hypothetical protein